ncbi:MAG: TIR domain-containing protein [Rhodomicrobium sp.]
MNTGHKAYAAFISYRHATRDREWAMRIFEALETYQIPKSLQKQGYPARVGKLFRDEDEIPASADLSDQIKHALAHSGTLIVICSPETPKSKWVRREIALFQELGRGDRIVPVLIGGEPDVSFPPELLRRRVERTLPDGSTEVEWEDFEPFAADVRLRIGESASKTFQRALLRLAAGIIGVTYDDLYQREAARRRTWQRQAAVAAAVCLLAVGGGGGWYWNSFLRTKTLYCANYGERWGVPFCAGEMGEGAAEQQRSVYQFKIRAGLPQEVTRVNGSLTPRGDPETLYESEDWTKDAARIVYGYHANGSLVRAVQYSQTGRQLRRLTFEFSEDRRTGIVRFDSDIGVAELQRAEGGSLGSVKSSWEDTDSKRTNIGQHRLLFDGAGYLLERRFEALGGGAQASDAAGAYGRSYRYGALGLAESIRNLDAVGDTLIDKSGVAEVRHSYDAKGRLLTVNWYNKSGHPVNNERLFARASFTRDALDRLIIGESFDADGKPAPVRDWNYAKILHVYDARGNVVEDAFFAADGKPTLHKDGYAFDRLKYDERGNVIESAFFGIDGRPTLNKNGLSILRIKYDERGNLIEAAYFGTDGKPALHKEGFATLRRKYDGRSNMVEEAYSGVDGLPALDKNGYAVLRRKFDGRGNLVEEAYSGTDGLPALHKNGYAVLRQKFDGRGNVAEWDFLGAGGNPALNQKGCAIVRQKYDEHGNIIEWGCFGAEGQLTLAKDGYASVRQKYDERGNTIEVALFGIDGKPAQHKNGHATIRRKYDGRGNIIEEAYIGTDGQPVLNKYGIAIMRRKYDERGDVAEQAYFGIDGNPTLHKDGNAIFRKKYDERGNVIEEAFFGADGKPLLLKDGYAILRKKYDERGNAIEVAYFDTKSNPISNKSGYARATFTYDDLGKTAKVRYFSTESGEISFELAVAEVFPNSTAEGIALAPGDRILAYNGKSVNSIQQLRALEDAAGPPRRALAVRRGADTLTIKVPAGLLGARLELVRGAAEPEPGH